MPGDDPYRRVADRAYRYFIAHFMEAAHGVFWTLDFEGRRLDTREQTCAQAYTLHGLSEYPRAACDPDVLAQSAELSECIEARAFDPANGGYVEAFDRA